MGCGHRPCSTHSRCRPLDRQSLVDVEYAAIDLVVAFAVRRRWCSARHSENDEHPADGTWNRGHDLERPMPVQLVCDLMAIPGKSTQEERVIKFLCEQLTQAGVPDAQITLDNANQ